MAQLASLNWGLEVGVLRSTHLALVTSLIQYGLVTFGSHIYEKQLDRLDTQVINVAARRITGVHRSARLEVLRLTAGVTSVRNMIIQQSGNMILRALEAPKSPLRTWILQQMQRVYAREAWNSSQVEFIPPKPFHARTNFHGFHEMEYVDTWSGCPRGMKFPVSFALRRT